MIRKQSFIDGIIKILVDYKVITEQNAQALKRDFKESSKENFDEFLLETGLVEKNELLDALSRYYKVPSIDVEGVFFDTLLLNKFAKDVLHRYGFIPLELDENILVVVASEPDDEELLPIIGQYVSYGVRFLVGLRRNITDAITEYYDEAATEIQPDEDLRRDHLESEGYRNVTLVEEEEDFPISDEDVLD